MSGKQWRTAILQEFDSLIEEGSKLIQIIKSDDVKQRRRLKGIMALGFEFHDREADVQAYKVRFRRFLELRLHTKETDRLMTEVETSKFASEQIQRIVGMLNGLKKEYENESPPKALNHDPEAERIIYEFDTVIADLKTLIDGIPDYSHERYRYRGNNSNPISQEDKERYFTIRTHCLKLLTRLGSQDTSLQQTIDYIRNSEGSLFVIKSLLDQIQGLRSDYEAGILTEFPRLQEPPRVASVHKRSWLNEPRAIIVAALIGAVAVILAALITIWVQLQSNSALPIEDSGVILTYTPHVRYILTNTPGPTSDVTAELMSVP